MNPEPQLSWQKKLAFSSIAILVFLAILAGLGEFAVRLMMPKSDPVKLGVTLDDSPRLYGLRTNYSGYQTGVPVQTNSLGFREKEYPVERAAGVRRVVVLGDSYTFGTGVNFEETFSKRLEKELNAAGQRYEVINFGVPGYNTTLSLATWREVASRYKPDLVIVGYVLNDTEQYRRGQDASGRSSGGSFIDSAHVAMKDMSMLYRFAAPKLGALAGSLFKVRHAVGRTPQIIQSFDESSPGWIESRSALLDIAREARAAGAAVLVTVFPMMVESYPLAAAHQRITEFCRQNGIDVVDMMPVVMQSRVSEMIVPLDGHPNGRAHEMFAERLFAHLARRDPALMRYLEQARGSGGANVLHVNEPR